MTRAAAGGRDTGRPVDAASEQVNDASQSNRVEMGDGGRRSAAEPRLGHMPALDGLRGIAVAAVVAFHGSFHWARGGFLGVTTFFVLSGFLITSLLLVEHRRGGRIDLRHFWARRARRLVPAVLVTLALVLLFAALGAHHPSRSILSDGIATLAWVANWRFIFNHQTYAAIFAAPSPLQHMWSLAVEEQFYIVLPILLVALGALRATTRLRLRLTILAVVGIAGSTFLCALLSDPRAIDRAYYGTDTRLAEPLVGVLLAVLLASSAGVRRLPGIARVLLDFMAIGAVAWLVVLMPRLTAYSPSVYHGGFLLVAVLSAVVIAAATQDGLVAAVLRFPLATGLGRISYGVYVFHWPVFLFFSSKRTGGLTGHTLFAAHCVITLAIALVSYFLVEQPVRQGRVPKMVGLIGWADVSVGLAAGLAIVSTTTPATASASASRTHHHSAVAAPAAAATTTSTAPRAAARATAAAAAPTTTAPPKKQSRGAEPAGAIALEGGDADYSKVPPMPEAPPGALKVVAVGDSMGHNLGSGLEAWAKTQTNVVVYNLSVPGCPLARGTDRYFPDGYDWLIPDYCNWWGDKTSERWRAFATFAPDVVVMQDGMNELPDRKGSWSGTRGPGDPQFDSWFLNELSKAVTTFKGTSGTRVLALNAVCAYWPDLGPGFSQYDGGVGDRRIAAIGRTTDGLSTAGAFPEDFQSHLCPNGRFTQNVDGVQDARPDGYHLSADAQYAVARVWLGPLVLQAGGRPTTKL